MFSIGDRFAPEEASSIDRLHSILDFLPVFGAPTAALISNDSPEFIANEPTIGVGLGSGASNMQR